jgi:hypothetical protein
MHARNFPVHCDNLSNELSFGVSAPVEKHHEDQDFPGYPETFGFALTSLVTCLAGSHLHNRQTRHLMQIAKDELEKPFSIGKFRIVHLCYDGRLIAQDGLISLLVD